jgi:hypothetical protein
MIYQSTAYGLGEATAGSLAVGSLAVGLLAVSSPVVDIDGMTNGRSKSLRSRTRC